MLSPAAIRNNFVRPLSARSRDGIAGETRRAGASAASASANSEAPGPTGGHVITREELREQVWATDTFVDFEHGLNAAINKLRQTLGDSAEKPRFIETLPGRGYRFVAAVRVSRRRRPPGVRRFPSRFLRRRRSRFPGRLRGSTLPAHPAGLRWLGDRRC